MGLHNFTKYDLTYFSSWVDSSLVCPQGHISRRPKGIQALKILVNKQCLVIHLYNIHCLLPDVFSVFGQFCCFFFSFFTIRVKYTKGESQIKPAVDMFLVTGKEYIVVCNRDHRQPLF